ncbi:hypothetical protein VMCG_05157 [Cytospora schulzeri]|uniref:Peptidase A1 domain-containing protein n=1 Tax=Cytospora schulzeri TaxID=448051 RepID=A0A423WR42_9PEZI|nr:hypothetical protein VMCG_05157 [Valsa malicola]
MLPYTLAVGFTLSSLTVAFPSPASLERTQVSTPLLRSAVRAQHGASGHSRVKRQDATGLDNQNDGTSYTIDIEVGTPPQTISVVLDTGSYELWVNPTCKTSTDPDFCESFPRYNSTESSTFHKTGTETSLFYGKGNVTFEYVKDVVSIGSASITDQVFGVASKSYSNPTGLLGVGPPSQGDDGALYTYVLDNMVAQGQIDSRAFSLDLRDIDSPDGSVIFGGVDTGKYIGSLEKRPMLDPDETSPRFDRYWVNLTSVGITLPSGESELIDDGEVPVFLDSGSTLSTLPTQLFENIGAAFPGALRVDNYFFVDCSAWDLDGSIDFGFGDKVISVSFNDFIWQSSTTGVCMLGVIGSDGESVLGDSFLRAAYVVYDQDNRNIHLAQAANCGSNLIAISSGEDAVPSVTGDCTAGPSPSVTGTLTVTQAPSAITGSTGGTIAAAVSGP